MLVRVTHTADLDPDTRDAARALLYDVFDDMADDDWEHCLGGLHAVAYDGDVLVAHASLIQRRLLYRGQPLRAGYVEGVGVRADRRGQGYGSAVMEPLERAIRTAYDIGALGSTDEGLGFYAARGWHQWQGPTCALTPAGIVRTEDDDGGVYVLPVSVPLDLTSELICDWRDGDVW